MPRLDRIATGEKLGNILDEAVVIHGGATTATVPSVNIEREDAGTNTAAPLLALTRTSSGTPANGIGGAINFYVETSPGNIELAGQYACVSSDVTATSEDFFFKMSLMTAGAVLTERWRVSSTGTISLTNGVDVISFTPTGSYSSTITATYDLTLSSTSGGTVAISSPLAPANTGVMALGNNGIAFGRLTNATPSITWSKRIEDITVAATFSIIAQSASDTATTHLTGGGIALRGGDGASGSAGLAHGGSVFLDGGLKYGTGTNGDVVVGNTRGRLNVKGGILVDATNTAGGTTGNRTINKSAGTVNFAAAATAITVSCDKCTADSLVFAQVRTNDSTATIKNVVPSANSFVITLNTAATAETSVGFFIVN